MQYIKMYQFHTHNLKCTYSHYSELALCNDSLIFETFSSFSVSLMNTSDKLDVCEKFRSCTSLFLALTTESSVKQYIYIYTVILTIYIIILSNPAKPSAVTGQQPNTSAMSWPQQDSTLPHSYQVLQHLNNML